MKWLALLLIVSQEPNHHELALLFHQGRVFGSLKTSHAQNGRPSDKKYP
jgi:hypothetical protein